METKQEEAQRIRDEVAREESYREKGLEKSIEDIFKDCDEIISEFEKATENFIRKYRKSNEEETQQIMKDYLLTEQEAIDLKEYLKENGSIPMYGIPIEN